MTFKIKLSQLPMPLDEFKRRVEAHVERLEEYFIHLVGVEIDKRNPALTPADCRVAFPAPSEDEVIEASIRRDKHLDGSVSVVADFEIEGPTLEEKKAALTAEVHDKEIKAIAKVIPMAKRRHLDFREADIHAVDHDLRSMEDAAFLNDIAARRAKQAEINRWAAKHEHDIHDLTEQTVDDYKIGGEFA